MSDTQEQNQNESSTEEITKNKKPPMYKVIIHNDDFTPMEFVVHVLTRFFNLTDQDANHIMMEVHKKGHGIAGVYTREIAETKVAQVNAYSRQHEHPLKTSSEKE